MILKVLLQLSEQHMIFSKGQFLPSIAESIPAIIVMCHQLQQVTLISCLLNMTPTYKSALVP